MTTKLSRVARVAGLVALAALATAPAAATAGTPTTVSVAGTQTVVDESAGTFAMQGSLVGTWQTTKFTPRYASATQYVASGREKFDGCLDSNKNGACDPKEPTGSMRFVFMYWASFDASGALVHGQCVHPVIDGSGTGGFRKAKGVIFMEDTPSAQGVVTTYTGTIEYDARASKSGHADARKAFAAHGSSARAQGAACGS